MCSSDLEGGGGLGYNNNVQVTPGQSYTVVVGQGGQVQTIPQSAGGSYTNQLGDSYFIDRNVVKGGGGQNALPDINSAAAAGGDYAGDGGGNAVDVFSYLKKKYKKITIWSHKETWNGWTYQRDKIVGEWAKVNNIDWIEYKRNGVVRDRKSVV